VLPTIDRLVFLIGVAVGGLGLSVFLEPIWSWPIRLIVILMAYLTCDAIFRRHPNLVLRSPGQRWMLGLLPATIIFEAFVLLPRITEQGKIAGLTFLAAILALVIVAQYQSMHAEGQSTARFLLNLMTYGVAFGLYYSLYSFEGDVQSALAAGLTTAALSVEILRGNSGSKTATYSLASGVVLAEAKLIMNFWPVDAIMGSIVLLLIFYVLSGTIQSYVHSQFTRSTLVEFSTVGVVAFVIVYGMRLWIG